MKTHAPYSQTVILEDEELERLLCVACRTVFYPDKTKPFTIGYWLNCLSAEHIICEPCYSSMSKYERAMICIADTGAMA